MSLPPLGPDGDNFRPQAARDPKLPSAPALPVDPPAQPQFAPPAPAPTNPRATPTFAPPPEPPGPGYSGSGAPSTAKNWMAIVSLVLGLVGAGLIGIFLAHGAIKAANRGEATNKGLGIAALVINYVAVGAVVLLIIGGVVFGGWTPGGANDGNQGSGLQPNEGGIGGGLPELDDPNAAHGEVDTSRVLDWSLESSALWYGLAIGDCVLDFYPPGTEDDETIQFDGIEVVPCTELHYGEVFVVTAISGDAAPNDATYEYHLESICTGAPFEAYVGAQWRDSALYYDSLYPADSWWYDGNHQFVCLLVEEDEESDQSFRDSGI